MATPSSASSDDVSDDEMPTSSVAELTITPNSNSKDDAINDDQKENDAIHQRRSATHSKLRAYEAKRRTAYESKLQSFSLYWHAFRTLMHDSLLETQKADLLVRGWTSASRAYGASMTSIGEWCIDGKGVPITEVKKKKKLFDATEKQQDVGVDSSASSASMFLPMNEKRGPLATADYFREEKCGSMIKNFADSAGNVSKNYEEMVKYMDDEVLPQLSSLLDHLKSEVMFTEKLGDSIMNELETAEDEVCRAWESYYNTQLDFCGTPSEASTDKPTGAYYDGPTPDASTTAVKGCSDVWVQEMRYRMAVAFLSSVWEKCSSELSKLFLSMKDAECNRRSQIKELMIKATQRQERLWIGLPSVVTPILKELVEWPMERKLVEDDVQYSIRERAQVIQRDEAEHKKPEESKSDAPGLTGVSEGDGNFELSSPLVSDLMCKAKVIEKRSPGMMSSWKVSLAVITSDSFLQLFELPTSCKLHTGSAPEVAFHNLIPPVVVPSMEGVKGGVKFPSSKYWFDHLVPSESFALPNCTVSLKDEKSPTTFEIVETISTSGAAQMFTKTMNRKMQLRAITREEAMDMVDALKCS